MTAKCELAGSDRERRFNPNASTPPRALGGTNHRNPVPFEHPQPNSRRAGSLLDRGSLYTRPSGGSRGVYSEGYTVRSDLNTTTAAPKVRRIPRCMHSAAYNL